MDAAAETRWRRRTPALLVYAVALGVRLSFLRVPIYGDEGAHYYVARSLAASPSLSYVTGVFPSDYAPLPTLFLQRPLFALALAPGALAGFDAYRCLFILLTALLPALAFVVLRERGVHMPYAIAAAAVLAVHPAIVVWSVHVFPDALATVAVLAALWAQGRGRAGLAGAAAVAAVWTKESALLALLALAALAWLRRRAREPGADRRLVASYRNSLVIAPLPLLLSLALGGRVPGWGRGGDIAWLLDHVTLSLWLALIILPGLLWQRSRPWAALALVYPAFYLTYQVGFGRAVEAWYLLLPATLVLLAAALIVDEAWNRTSKARRRARAGVAAGLMLVLLVVAAPLVIASPLLAPFTHPASQARDLTLKETFAHETSRDDSLFRLAAAAPLSDPILLVDVEWYYILHPFLTGSHTVVYGYTRITPEASIWRDAIENRSQSFVIGPVGSDAARNEALRATYQECLVAEFGAYAAYRGCAGAAI